MLNKKAKFKNTFKKIISVILAFTIFLFSSVAIPMLNGNLTMKAAYFNDYSFEKQTRFMMNGDNTLNINYWMNVDIKADPLNAGKCAATLNFVIPDKNLSDLKFYVRDRSSISNNFVEYQTAPNLNYLYLNNLNDNVGYEIHVYDGSLASENFVIKSEFIVYETEYVEYEDEIALINAINQPLYDVDGFTALNLKIVYTKIIDNKTQFIFVFPTKNTVPFDAQTVKVAFFADADSRSEKEINIDHVLYDYCCDAGIYYLYFIVDAQWGTDANTKYEAHFYKDSVQPENFLCKAVSIPTTAP